MIGKNQSCSISKYGNRTYNEFDLENSFHFDSLLGRFFLSKPNSRFCALKIVQALVMRTFKVLTFTVAFCSLL